MHQENGAIHFEAHFDLGPSVFDMRTQMHPRGVGGGGGGWVVGGCGGGVVGWWVGGWWGWVVGGGGWGWVVGGDPVVPGCPAQAPLPLYTPPKQPPKRQPNATWQPPIKIAHGRVYELPIFFFF